MDSRHLLPLAALALAIASLGPWAHGTFVEQPIFGEEQATSRTVMGWEAGGTLLAALALAIAVAAWVAPAARASRLAILGALVGTAVGLALALSNDGLSMSLVYFHVFAEWRDVRLGAGLIVACVAWLVAAGVWFVREVPPFDADAESG
ncbi:MAG TPA: hypothetical protein VFH78_08725 [Candidatus Thermoplasmatota archaeon]|nr:hypothetical protein [Candidatus Thermoplasmatota archaeon]